MAIKMRHKLLTLLLIVSINSFAQKMTIINFEGEKIEITLSNNEETKNLVNEFNGVKDDLLRKKWIARTYKLSNNKILIEFFDAQSALIENEEEFWKLKNVRFVKNNIWNLKKNISYKIEIPFEEGRKLANSNGAIRLKKYKSDMPKHYDFEVYELATKQILFIDLSAHSNSATIYKDIKTLASENGNIEEIEYRHEDDEYYMKELAKGNAFEDIEPNEHLIYPKYIEEIIKNHGLSLKKTKVFVNDFWGNLYQSERGYWVLIDEAIQPNGTGEKMLILSLRIFDNLECVREAQNDYEKLKEGRATYEHFYQKISDAHGKDFPNHVDSLISVLPRILNFDNEQLSLDEDGLSLIDEAIRWNHDNWKLFDTWFPSVLAYYGEFYIKSYNNGKWESKLDIEDNIWIPQITLDDETSAFDMISFYKNLNESPMPIKWAGDFDGIRRKTMRRN